jgi:hypothetical protein
MDTKWNLFLEKSKLNPPVSPNAITHLLSKVNFNIPTDYLDFLAITNGFEGLIGNTYISLWKAEYLIKNNDDYRTEVFAPGHFIIGSNLGGSAYAFDNLNGSIVTFEFISMLINDKAVVLAPTFYDFVTTLIDLK